MGSNKRSMAERPCLASLERGLPVCVTPCANMRVPCNAGLVVMATAIVRTILMALNMNKHTYVTRHSNPGSTNRKQTKLTWTGRLVNTHVGFNN